MVRALAADPDIILMDEPFSALDPISRQKLQQDISDLQKRIKKTIVFVTHDMQEAIALGDRICLMQDGEVVQIDTPEEILRHPENEFVRNFLDSGNAHSQSVLGSSYTVQDLLDENLHLSYQTDDGSLYVNASDSLDSLIQTLADTKSIPVKDADGNFIATVTNQHVLRFLSIVMERQGEHV
ncbi:Glycine betaine/L-proline transport ATP-binding protein ProV [Listeria grayi]|uniref:Glycine betaine/L-proline transport ATP-binding protein ProV n=1 Tax=Listeria grayi TaxID=1641 RepID=A0A378MA41_LISGR|nr:Glycine betaine/L-proline transport ATP-binding protein ProV [Listeria grayi]